MGAILTQNTSWKNVERALEQLRSAEALDPHVIHDLSAEELAELIRPAGYYRLKAKRLKNLVGVVIDEFGGNLPALLELDRDALRERLLRINGVGPETADSIVLYAAQQPLFVVDRYTARVLKRHGWIEPEADYHQIQAEFHAALPRDTALFNEYHALIVKVGGSYCGREPKCDGCPLADMLPEGGPYEPRC